MEGLTARDSGGGWRVDGGWRESEEEGGGGGGVRAKSVAYCMLWSQ